MNLKKLLPGLSLCPDESPSAALPPEAPAPPPLRPSDSEARRRGERLPPIKARFATGDAKSGRVNPSARLRVNRGSVLIVTIWIISVLVLFVIGLSMIVSNRILSFKILRDTNRAYLVALGSVNKAIEEINKEAGSSQFDCLNEKWSNNPEAFNNIIIGNGTGEVSYEYPTSEECSMTLYGCADEERLININKAGPNVLQTFFKEVAGLNEFEAASLTDCIIDWRDEDTATRPHGAEIKEYESTSATYSSKNAPFDVPEELMLVKGMTPDIYRKIKDAITVYGSGRININTATESSLVALGLSPSLIRKIFRFRSGRDTVVGNEDDNIIVRTEETAATISRVEPLVGEEISKLNDLVIQDLITVESKFFRIKSKGTVNNKTRQITCIIRRGGGIVFWQE